MNPVGRIFPDSVSSSTDKVLFIGDGPIMPLCKFLVVQDIADSLKWVVCISAPNRNIPFNGLAADDPRLIKQIQRDLQGNTQNFFTEGTNLYEAEILGQIEDDNASDITKRPRGLSPVYEASQEDVAKVLQLPRQRENGNRIALLENTDVSVCINQEIIDHGGVIAGSTGSGKSEAMGRMIDCGQYFNRCQFIIDQKPDYQDLGKPNEGNNIADPRSLSNVIYWSLSADVEQHEKPISVKACELDIGFFSQYAFGREGEENGKDLCRCLMSYFSDHEMSGSEWTLDSFMEWFLAKVWDPESGTSGNFHKGTKDEPNPIDTIYKGTKPHPKTMQTVYKLIGRCPSWIDRKGKSKKPGQTAYAQSFFDYPEAFEPGVINVIRVNGVDSYDYALFASTLLNKLLTIRAEHNSESPWMQVWLDEAQDIFNGEDSLKKIAVPKFAEMSRKGRSKHLAIWYALQSIDQMPDQIIQNTLSKIVMRQGSKDVAMKALGDKTKAMQATSFRPGDAFVNLYNCATSWLRVRMLRSPFYITKQEIDDDYGA